ncbi:MAG: hypothetical protein ACD_71C00170G0004 [uncultured bacterium (gcode 4)]|uniref:Uncharacterized protein n=1 Tax=uncultured bacterium (gcode 4) TaxID=1234023 RepID=K1YN04_9BACT|nr:MAG: hypothetical protein ACD_71C00170G0004 [uncultured bacterium (gcode 4)]
MRKRVVKYSVFLRPQISHKRSNEIHSSSTLSAYLPIWVPLNRQSTRILESRASEICETRILRILYEISLTYMKVLHGWLSIGIMNERRFTSQKRSLIPQWGNWLKLPMTYSNERNWISQIHTYRNLVSYLKSERVESINSFINHFRNSFSHNISQNSRRGTRRYIEWEMKMRKIGIPGEILSPWCYFMGRCCQIIKRRINW